MTGANPQLEYRITDDLEKLKTVLPDYLVDALEQNGREDDLIEVILDLGRVPTARYSDVEKPLDSREITPDEIQYVVTKIGMFDADNRAGLERTLHRISAIRNRHRDIVGLTVRIGRAVYGTIDIIQDLIESGQSILMLGAPGVGKTTMLREAARVLADSKRVIIVDTSNEIGGDGDVPHPAVGKARRMQVPQPSLQHEVMIEAVENHNPEVIIIDEIGRALEAEAARTIAERGVQLIGTAHGQTLDNLMNNPTLADLIGGIKSVTLSDEEARRRGTQKTVLERAAPPTFDVLIEIQNRHRLAVHEDVAAAVDGILRGRPLGVEVRYRDAEGEVVIETHAPPRFDRAEGRGNGRSKFSAMPLAPTNEREPREVRSRRDERSERPEKGERPDPIIPAERPQPEHQVTRVLAYGVARNRLAQAARRMRVPLVLEDEINHAQAVVTLKNYYRRRPKLIMDAERKGISIYVLRANTVSQMEDFISDLFHLQTPEPHPFGHEEEHYLTEDDERFRRGAKPGAPRA
ncbi:MAG: AAA family ATPase [Anaerolinea sp.]|nr:AAA family ATPase [Anaerolinea sp.]MCC6974860.1 AAA family ATPase [Anaerolineae bacterium]